MTTPRAVNMLWVGTEIGYIERLSVASFLTAGHPVHLHTYNDVKGVPDGVQLRDANEVMHFDDVLALRHSKSGSFALASDLFRFRLQKLGVGLWADMDVVCLRPIELRDPMVFGWESENFINGAVLFLDSQHSMVDAAISAFLPRTIPHWIPRKKALPFQIKRWLGLQFGPQDFKWGTFGPKAITALAEKFGLTECAQPIDVFYPISFRQARRMFEPGFSIEEYLTERTLSVHLWNEMIRREKNSAPPASSPLRSLLQRFGI